MKNAKIGTSMEDMNFDDFHRMIYDLLDSKIPDDIQDPRIWLKIDQNTLIRRFEKIHVDKIILGCSIRTNDPDFSAKYGHQ